MGFPQAAQSLKNGLLLVGHGTRNAQGLAEFWAVARQVAELADEFLVEPCFLELAEPSIPQAVERLLRHGIERFTVAPLLLFAAGHAKRDIPAAVEAAVKQRSVAGGQWSDGSGDGAEGGIHKAATAGRAAVANRVVAEGVVTGGVVIDYLGALECQERIMELSTQRYAEAVNGRPHMPAAETLLLLVGRGSSHAEAIEAMQRFAALRAEQTAVGRVEVCFAAVATPTLKEALDMAARSGYRRIVVQPHLLFTGEVLEQIAAAVKEQEAEGGRQKAEVGRRQAESGCDKEWIIAPHLGPSPLVAQAVVEIARSRRL